MNTIRKLLLIAVLSCPFVPAFSAIGDTIVYGGVHYVVTVEDDSTAGYEVAIDHMDFQSHISVPATVRHNGRDYKITSHTNSIVLPYSPDGDTILMDKIDFTGAEYITSLPPLPYCVFSPLRIDTFILPPNITSYQAPVGYQDPRCNECRPFGIMRLFASGNSLRRVYLSSGNALVEVDISLSSVDSLLPSPDVAWGTFQDCRWLEKVRLNESVRYFGSISFLGCSRLHDMNMPDSLTSISWDCFNGDMRMDSIWIPANARWIIPEFIRSHTFLKSIVVDTVNRWFKSSDGVMYTKSGLTAFKLPFSLACGNIYDFPEDVDSIAPYFHTNTGAHYNFITPENLCEIYDIGFNCGLRHIGKYAFYNSSLKIARNFGCTSVRVIPRSCFGDSDLESIELPVELTDIEHAAFQICRHLAYVRFLGAAVSSIGNAAFMDCVLLDTLDLSAQTRLRIISDSLFQGCTSLRYVSLPNGIDSIGRRSFYNCTSLDRIEVPLLEPIQIHDDVFYGVDKSSCTLVVPAQAIGKYSTSPVWREFMNVESGNLVALSVLSSDTTMGTASGSGVFRVGDRNFVYAVARPGYMFTGWSDDASILSASRYVDLSVDSVITANFAIDPDFVYNVSVRSVDPSMGYVSSSLPYAHYGDELTVSATAYSGYRFVGWSDGVDENPYSLTVVCDTVLTACFEAVEAVEYMVGAKSEDEVKGVVAGGGMYREGEVAELVATANDGYAFVEWRDGAGNVFSDDVLSVVVLSDSVFTAYFGEDEPEIPDSVETVCAGMTVTVSRDGVVSVGGNAGGRMTLHTAAGGLVYSGEVKEVMLPSAGSYILTVKDISFKIVWP